MSSRQLFTAVAFAGIFAMAARVSLDTDTWWHLRAGTWMLENRAILQTDPFSYTRGGAVWQYPGWIVQIPLALIYLWLGPGGLNLWTAGMVTLAFAFVWRAMEGETFLKGFIVVFGAAVSGVYWAARPYLVTFVLAGAFLWILEDFRRGRRDRLAWLPVGMALWANSHGGFAVGFILWGIYGFEVGVSWLAGCLRGGRSEGGEAAALRRMLVVGALMVLAVCVNPAGPAMLWYPFKTVGIEALQNYIQEWQSPNFHQVSVQPFAWLLLVTLGAVGASRRGLAWVDFLLVAVFAYLGLLAGRNVALFGLVAPVVLARHAGAALERAGVRFPGPGRGGRRLRTLNGAVFGLVLVAAAGKVALVWPVEANERAFREFLPVEAAAFLRETRPDGRLFNSYNWGAYLLWALPEYPVFVDGRTDLYDDEIIGQWFQVARAEEGWQEALARWEVNVVLLERGLPVVSRLEGEGWRLLYEDELAVVYAR